MDERPNIEREFSLEIEHGHASYTDEELLEQSQFNAQALLLASSSALGDDPAAREAWTHRVAEIFLRTWDREREWGAPDLLDALLTNYRSFGAQVIEADLTAAPVTATIAELPDVGLVESMGLQDSDADAIFMIGAHLASALGHELTWEREAETGDVRLTVA
jgi:hypothetical protein